MDRATPLVRLSEPDQGALEDVNEDATTLPPSPFDDLDDLNDEEMVDYEASPECLGM
jgi:hypothetical protein